MRTALLASSALIAATAAVTPVRAQDDDLPSREKMWEIIQKQQKEIKRLKKKTRQTQQNVEKTERKVEATAKAINNVRQSGSAGGGWWENTQIGGYGELHYRGDTSLQGAEGGEAGTGSEINFKRFIVNVNHDFSDNLRLKSELEFENVLAGEGKPGEVELEQAWLEYDLTDKHSTHAGLKLVPVGLINETHEPPTFYGVQRPLVERRIIPTTWWEAQIGLNGQLGSGFSYDASLHSGLNASLEGGEGAENVAGDETVGNAFLPAGATELAAVAPAESGAGTFNLEWTGMPGVELGGTLQYQMDVTQDRENVDGMLTEVHADIQRGNFGFRALYARWDFFGDAPVTALVPNAQGNLQEQQVATLEGSGRDQQYGWYVEPSYRFDIAWGELGFFGRYSRMDNRAGSDVNSTIAEIEGGLNFWPHPNVVVKANYKHQNADQFPDEDTFNLGLGYQF